MAITTWTEDWGSTLGTAGQGGWAAFGGDGFETTTQWAVAPDSLITPGGDGTAANAMGSAIAWTGSQAHTLRFHSVSPVRFVALACGTSGGTGYYWELYNSLSIGVFRLLRRTSGGWAAATSADLSVIGSGISGTLTGGYMAGTLTGLWTCGTDSKSIAFGVGTDYAPGTALLPRIGYRQSGGTVAMLTSTWEYNRDAPVVIDTILRFLGTWATGSGTYEWGADVIGAPSNIQDRAFGPLDSAGWASTVSVTLDDSRGQWGSFAGTGQWPYEGTWQFRRQWNAGEVSGTWVTLLTGFVEPESVQYNYANRTARLTVQSSIARASQKIAIHDGNTFSSRQMSVPCYQGLLGTITYADSSTGTIRVGNVQGGYWLPESRCRLWGTFGTETESVTVGSSITPIGIFGAGGTGTLVVDGEFPGWMDVGAEIWLTRPWPSYSDRNSPASGLAFTYVQALLDRLGLTWPADNQQLFQKQSSSSPISPNFRMYGGEKLTTALTGIMQACNGFFSVSPAGEFRVHCSLPTYSAVGSVDFLTAYDSDWSMGYEASVTGIELDSSFNPETGSYTTHTSVGGTAAWGAVRELKLPWVGSGIEAESLAGRLYRDSYIPRPSLTLRMPGSRWDGYEPGYTYNVENLPAHLVSKMAGTQFVLYSKTHDWQDDLTALELVAQPGGNYAVWDGTPADTWHESGKVWY